MMISVHIGSPLYFNIHTVRQLADGQFNILLHRLVWITYVNLQSSVDLLRLTKGQSKCDLVKQCTSIM